MSTTSQGNASIRRSSPLGYLGLDCERLRYEALIPIRILLAEDDNETADYVEHGLGELGHIVTRAANGQDALHLGLTNEYEIIVLDRMMPRLEGADVLRRLRTQISTPILVLNVGQGDKRETI